MNESVKDSSLILTQESQNNDSGIKLLINCLDDLIIKNSSSTLLNKFNVAKQNEMVSCHFEK
jgi:hypothetical protein